MISVAANENIIKAYHQRHPPLKDGEINKDNLMSPSVSSFDEPPVKKLL